MGLCALIALSSSGVSAQDKATVLKPSGRIIVLGFDGIDHARVKRMIAAGQLKRLASLQTDGTFAPLQTTTPAQSPVSWSSLITGKNPGKTGIDGFLRRRFADGEVEVELSLVSSEVDRSGLKGRGNRSLALGGLAIVMLVGGVLQLRRGRRWGGTTLLVLLAPLSLTFYESMTQLPDGRPTPVNQRHGKTYWELLDAEGIHTSTLMAPCCFPAEHLNNGRLLCGLGVPDIAGSPGFWTLFRDDLVEGKSTETGGRLIPLTLNRSEGSIDIFEFANVPGPRDLLHPDQGPVTTSLKVSVDRDLKLVKLDNSLSASHIPDGEWSKPFSFLFPVGRWNRVRGHSRFKVLSYAEPFKLYLDPIGFDPAELPEGVRLSHPDGHALDLQLKCGPFETVGWACATNALKDGHIDEKTFLEDALRVWTEQETMALHELSHDDTRLVTAIFTATDRIQHMFSRYDWTELGMNGEKASSIYREAIDQAYVRMDDFIGRVLDEHVGPDDILFVVSDHGFAPWRRAVNLNRFLIEKGYLTLKDRTGPRSLVNHLGGGGALQQVDWRRTKAYSVGLGKIYLNRAGREPQGTVNEENAPALIEKIGRELLDMSDNGAQVVSAVTRGQDAYQGDAIPEGSADIYVGFQSNFRVSWQSCLGGADEPLIFDNLSAWSGDHCSVDPAQVPGVLFCNRRLSTDNPRVVDIAPTVMELFGFGLQAPDSPLDGHSLLIGR